jgi:putative intracellular protease/amidase
MKTKKILIAVTSHSEVASTGEKTGYYLSEVSHPAQVFTDAGYEIDFVSPQGGIAPMDPASDETDPVSAQFLKNQNLKNRITHTLRPEQVNASQYAAVFFAGGLGTMWDFRENRILQQIAQTIYESGGVISGVCHGPAALVDVKLSTGKYLVESKKIAGFSNAEEIAHETADVVPFLLENALRSRGAVYSSAGLWEEHVVVDGKLVTGQNPASASLVGKKVLEVI